MADPQLVTQEEMALRRRARRRLVGAVAIALLAVVFLPMLFDPEPKPLGEDVDLRIPSKDTPFEPSRVVPAAPEPPPQSAEPTLPAPAPLPAGEVDPLQPTPPAPPPAGVASPEVGPGETRTDARPEDKAGSKPASARTVQARPEPKPEPKLESKPAAKPEPKTAAKPEAKPAPKPEPIQGTRGFVLQLGAFGSETNAKLLLDKVQAAGFKAMIQSGGGQFRVRVGPLADHEKAVELQNKLKAKGFSPVLMGP